MAMCKVYKDCMRRLEDDGAAAIKAKEVAVLIRARLKRTFPGVKFSVRSDHNSVDIRWTDGPHPCLVEPITNAYSFGGFDGSIDLAYGGKNWLMPDGTMAPAASEGTEGSRGSVPGYATDAPHGRALLVKFGPRYVFCQRDLSPDMLRALCEATAEKYGYTIRHDVPLADQRIETRWHGREYLTTLAYRLDHERAEKGAQS